MIRINPRGSLLAAALLAAAGHVHAADTAMPPPHCPPVVPPATAAPQQGTARLRLLLREDGSIAEAHVERSSGHAGLDAAARAMALRCRFQPYRVDGKASKAWVALPVSMETARPTAVLANGAAAIRAFPVDVRHCARADYPAAAQAQGAQGTTYLGLLIGTDGLVQESRLERSSGHPQLDEAARAALSACRFAPALQDGAPVQQWTRASYVWQLDSQARAPLRTVRSTPPGDQA